MIAPLLVLVAQALDGLTFLMAVNRWGLSGESNVIAQLVIGAWGVGGLLLFKAIGASLAAGIVAKARRWRTSMAVLGVGVGLIGVLANLSALVLA